jgi:hypothetical protein
MSDMVVQNDLTLHIDGATPEECRHGLEAAKAVFRNAGVTAFAAVAARLKGDGWDMAGLQNHHPLTDEEAKIVDLWDEADHAAVEACCVGWSQKPKFADLDLDYEIVADVPRGLGTFNK